MARNKKNSSSSSFYTQFLHLTKLCYYAFMYMSCNFLLLIGICISWYIFDTSLVLSQFLSLLKKIILHRFSYFEYFFKYFFLQFVACFYMYLHTFLNLSIILTTLARAYLYLNLVKQTSLIRENTRQHQVCGSNPPHTNLLF